MTVYLDPSAQLRFGDIFEAPWLFDAFVSSKTVPMFRKSVPGPDREAWFERGSATGSDPETILLDATLEPAEAVLTSGSLRMAIVLTDDCELATMSGERPGHRVRGRVLMAGLRPLDGTTRGDLDLGIHTLEPDESRHFPGALVDFGRLFAVQTKSLLATSGPDFRKVLSLDDDARFDLYDRFGGHVVRQGSRASEIALTKLAQLLTAGSDPDAFRALRGADDPGDTVQFETVKAIHAVLDDAWLLGHLLGVVDDLAEELAGQASSDVGTQVNGLSRQFAAKLRAMSVAAAIAADGLEDAGLSQP